MFMNLIYFIESLTLILLPHKTAMLFFILCGGILLIRNFIKDDLLSKVYLQSVLLKLDISISHIFFIVFASKKLTLSGKKISLIGIFLKPILLRSLIELANRSKTSR